MEVQAKLYPTYVEVWHEGRRVARHERCYRRRQQILDLEHYLEPLSRKPGALAGSTALLQWRQRGRWKASHDQMWQVLNARHGRQNGTRLMVDIIGLGREHGYDRLGKPSRKRSRWNARMPRRSDICCWKSGWSENRRSG